MVAHWSSKPPQPPQQQPQPLRSTSSASRSPETAPRPQPMEVPNGAPPPFLLKTYDMVDDQSTDPIVSWNNGGNGFVVWNSNEFQKELLPKFFKHNNFSSFVRQLNTYGFRKIDPDRWEFANEAFLKGQKQLLRGIHRRRSSPHGQQQSMPPPPPQTQHSKPSCVEVGKFGIEGEIDRLKRDKNVLMAELVRLRQHQQQTDRDLQMVLQRLHSTEQRQQQMVSFLAKAMQSPSFLAQLVQQNEANKRLAVRKKRRLPKQDNETDVVVDEGPSSPVENQIVKYQPNSSDPVSMLMQYLNSPELSPKVELPSLFRELEHGEGLTLTEMNGRMMGEVSPSRMMRELSESLSSVEEMQVAAPASPLSLMRFESVEGGEGGEEAAEEGGGGGVLPTAEQMADVDFEWDQFFAQAGGGEIDESGANQWWDENGSSPVDNVDELTQQIRQLTS